MTRNTYPMPSDAPAIRVEPCGCRWRVANGALIRGCRRHDPQVAGRIVAALEERCRFLWREIVKLRRLVGPPSHDPEIFDVTRWAFALILEEYTRELTALLRIRRAGRT